MTNKLVKRALSALPTRHLQELKRILFAHRIRTGKFTTDEPEYRLLDTWLKKGDWVLDVGANIGHYALRCSQLVGAEGRVFAFEPVPSTFELLSANSARLEHSNVTLLNVAVSSESQLMGISIPKFDHGLVNYYEAQVTTGASQLEVMSLRIDQLFFSKRIALVKIDVEGHEYAAIRGMEKLIERDRPVLIVEGGASAVESFLVKKGYRVKIEENSPNRVYHPADSGA